jgi:hypothetical protein
MGDVGELNCCGEESVESSSDSVSFGGALCWFVGLWFEESGACLSGDISLQDIGLEFVMGCWVAKGSSDRG